MGHSIGRVIHWVKGPEHPPEQKLDQRHGVKHPRGRILIDPKTISLSFWTKPLIKVEGAVFFYP